jgi:RimJ/RimL family protein N-acetyltransferase
MTVVPRELVTERLVLRAWRGEDAEELRPILLANQDHLRPWIPESTYSAPPLPELVTRLESLVAVFDAGSAFRYAIRHRTDGRVLGGTSLFPHDGTRRVTLAEADRVEIGYWLDAAVTGRGYVTEAVRALLRVSATLPSVTQAEIRCHVDNAPSAAVPKRLGFELAGVVNGMQVWRRDLVAQHDGVRKEVVSDFPPEAP